MPRMGGHYKGVGFALASDTLPYETAGGPGSDQTVLTNPFGYPYTGESTGGGYPITSTSGLPISYQIYNSLLKLGMSPATAKFFVDNAMWLGLGAVALVIAAKRR
jgi:hypothetical protein